MARKIYFIPGLGTTSEVFCNLDVSFKEVEFLEFPEPTSGENLKSYAAKMATIINNEDENILVGLSMGGFIAQEIALIKTIEKIILISSINKIEDWQRVMKWLRKFDLAKLIAARVFKNAVIGLLPLAVNSSDTNIDFIKMAKQFSARYYKFAIVQLSQWKALDLKTPVIRIHGDSDELFALGNDPPKYIVKGGKHLMIATHAKEISNFLKEALLG